MSPEFQTFLLAMTPLGELRVALPVALSVYKMHWIIAFWVAVFGNLVPVVFLLLFLEPVSNFLSRHCKIFKYLFDWLFKKTRQRANHRIQKYGYPALVLFVAIPLPITGAWTGSLIAFLFNIPFKKAFPLIAAGVAIAGLIVSATTGAGIAIEKYLGWQTLLGTLVIIGLGWLTFKKLKLRNS